MWQSCSRSLRKEFYGGRNKNDGTLYCSQASHAVPINTRKRPRKYENDSEPQTGMLPSPVVGRLKRKNTGAGAQPKKNVSAPPASSKEAVSEEKEATKKEVLEQKYTGLRRLKVRGMLLRGFSLPEVLLYSTSRVPSLSIEDSMTKCIIMATSTE